MKAALLREKNKLELTDVKIPEIGAGEALVRVAYSGICGSDIHIWRGHHPTATYPRIPGHEFSGVLEKFVGTPRDGLKTGDPVVVQPFWSCGLCEPCIRGMDNVCRELKVIGFHEDGSFAEYIRVPLKKIYRLPGNVDLRLGAITEPLSVAVHDVRRSGLMCGEKALITGGGPIGMLVALVAQHAGAADVYISEINEYRLEFAKKLGIKTINPLKTDLKEETLRITRGKGFDVVYEASGSKPCISAVTDVVKSGGTILMIGMSSELHPLNLSAMFAKELTVKGVRLHAQQNFEGAIALLESGKLNEKLNMIIDNEFSLDDFVKAMNFQVEDPNHFKVMIKIG
jgi:2-desacetyl-2-hydroxyethyl bacteriochlorophyllide A dehydrogenase